MSILHLGRERALRRAFGRWAAGHQPPPVTELEELAGRDRCAAWCLGACLAEAGRPDEALEALAAARPAFRAVALLWAGRSEEARALVDGEKGLLEQSVAGLAALEIGDLEAAARAWRTSPPVHWRLVGPRAFAATLRAHHRLDPEGLTDRLAEDLLEPSPPRPLPLVGLFRRILDLCQLLLPTLRGDREDKALIRLLSLQSRGQGGEAIALARQLRREFREESWPAEALAELLAQAGKDREVLDLPPETPAVAARREIALARLGRWREAADLEAGELHPEVELYQLYARACAQALTGQTDAATRNLVHLRRVDAIAFQDVADREVGRLISAASP